MNYNKTCLVFGATGLVGKQLINQLVAIKYYEKIRVFNRTRQNYPSDKIEEYLVNFDQLSDQAHLFDVNHVYVCLGTTIKKAKSKEVFEKVDLEYPVKIAQLAADENIEAFVHISSLGADIDSNNFYLKTKGKAEKMIRDVGLKNVYSVRPSMLLGKRDEFRLGESIGKFLMQTFEFLMLGKLKKYRGIYDHTVARAMIIIANKKPTEEIIESEALKIIAKANQNEFTKI